MAKNERLHEYFEVKTGGHWLVKLLNRKGVEFVFGTTGGGMPDIQDAMVVVKPPKWIQGLHEFVSVSAATGYALASGKPGVALVDRVVGLQNVLGALYGAWSALAPVVVLASENVAGEPIPTGEHGYHYHEAAMLSLALTWSKWAARVGSLETMPYDLERAFQLASAEPKGPVVVTLRQDLMAKQVEEGYRVKTPQQHPSFRVPDDAAAQRFVEAVLAHERPCILTSHAGRDPEAVWALVELSHTLGLGVVERRAFMNYPMSDPHHLGFTGPLGFSGLPEGCDLLILVEAGLLPHVYPQVEEVIDVSSDPSHKQDTTLGGDYGGALDRSTLRIVGDTAPTLRKLASTAKRLVAGERGKIEDRSAKLAQAHREYYERWWEHSRSRFNGGVLDGYSVGYALGKHWGKELVWVNGAITPRDGLFKNIVLDTPGTYFGNPSGHLGVTVGMAYGVALADKTYADVVDGGGHTVGRMGGGPRIVVCTLGDGEAMFGNIGSALWTCAHYSIPVVYVVLNNACWGIEWSYIERSSQQWAKGAGDYEFVDIDRPRIDFAKIAEAFEVRSTTATTPLELEEAFAEALRVARGGRPALIDVNLPKHTGPKPSSVP